MRERVDLKSPVREYRSPGSVRGASGNRRPYLDKGGNQKADTNGTDFHGGINPPMTRTDANSQLQMETTGRQSSRFWQVGSCGPLGGRFDGQVEEELREVEVMDLRREGGA